MKPAVVQQQLVKVLLGYVDAALVPQQGPASEMQVVVASIMTASLWRMKSALRCRALWCQPANCNWCLRCPPEG